MTEKVIPNATVFRWTVLKRKAAQLLAEDELADWQIAAECSTTKITVERWKRHPEFRAEVARLAKELGDATERFAIGRQLRRVRALQERWDKLQAVIAERADDPRMEGIPGGKTGLLVVKDAEIVYDPDPEKPDGPGIPREVILEVAVDTGLLTELRKHEEQAAKELGQWTEKREVTGKDGKDLIPKPDYESLRRLSVEELNRIYQQEFGHAAERNGKT